MRVSLWLGLLLSCSVCAAETALIPAPSQLDLRSGHFRLPTRLQVSAPAEATRLKQQLARFIRSNQLDIELRWVDPSQAQLIFEFSPNADSQHSQSRRGAYQLNIGSQQIRVSAADPDGWFYALQSMQQLLLRTPHAQLPALTLTDSPRFDWRGLLLDPARHFLSIPLLKRQIDLMAAVKLNVLHLHLTDDQGWRFESKRFPKLQQLGGQDGYYTQDELKELVQYAKARAVRIVPEIDLPGHTTALGLAYPELMAAPAPSQIEQHWGVHKAVLDPSNEQVYRFLHQLLEELTSIFPDQYLHIGGDEVLPDHWLASPEIRRFMQQQQLQDAHALQAYFNRRLLSIVQLLGKTMIGWDEVIDHPLPASVTVQSWRGTESLLQATALGHPAILSTGYYLDQPQSAAYHYRNDPLPAQVRLPDSASLRGWSLYSLEFARKRGTPVTGQLLITDLQQPQPRAFLLFAGKALIEARLSPATQSSTSWQLHFDSWMGPVSADLELSEALSGTLVVGNAPYPVAGQALTLQSTSALPSSFSAASSTTARPELVLGGEIALWSELISTELIDIRLWPNALAVAERLWSDARIKDEQSFYQRQSHWLQWAEQYNSLQLQQQQRAGLQRLVKPAQLGALMTLSEVMEPAHYYHRLHEKSVAGRYFRQPLTAWVDFLPAEHQAMRQFEQLVQRWIQQPKAGLTQKLIQQLQRWQQAALVFSQQPQLEFAPLAQQTHALSQIGMALVQQRQLSPAELNQARAALQQAAGIQQEMIIALQRPLQQLLQQAEGNSAR